MRISMRYPVIILLSIALIILQFACAHGPQKITSPPTEQIKVDFGTIGVVSGQFQPESKFKKPKGKIATAAAGAGLGALIVGEVVGGIVALNPPSLVLVAYPPIAAGIGCAAGGAALIGGVVGAVAGESSKKIKKTERTLNDVIAELRVQETLRDQTVVALRKQTNHPFLLVEGKGPAAPDQEINYGFLADEGIDTVLEISVLRFGLWGDKGINPPLAFFMTARAKLILIKDNSVISTDTFRYENGHQKFIDWAAYDSQPFREEFSQCYRKLAKDIVRKLFPNISFQNEEININTRRIDPEWDRKFFPEGGRRKRYDKVFP